MGEGMARPGIFVGRYRLQERLGCGTMGEVWRGYDSRLSRSVAVKLIDPFQSDPAELERFLQEARALGRVSHPNVVTVYDVGEWSADGDPRPFIVMELLEGRTLADELAERGPLEPNEVREAGLAIARGLRAVHEAGVVHRDLTPANLMRTAGGEVKLIDFGIADVGRQGRLTQPGRLLGSVTYAAPERVRGERADARADLYSFGCVLYELLCGRPPFEGDLVAVAFAHVFNDVVPPVAVRPEVPDELDAVVLALLAKDPAARPPTAASVVAALRDGVAAMPSTPTQVGQVGPGVRRLTMRRLTSVLAAAAVVVLATGSSASLVPEVRRPARAAPTSVAPPAEPERATMESHRSSSKPQATARPEPPAPASAVTVPAPVVGEPVPAAKAPKAKETKHVKRAKQSKQAKKAKKAKQPKD